jgi:hypothetical protein
MRRRVMLTTRGITTHSTRARIELLSCARLALCHGSSRRVNSGVRLLLNNIGDRNYNFY